MAVKQINEDFVDRASQYVDMPDRGIEKIKKELEKAFEKGQEEHSTGLTIITPAGFDFIINFFEPYLKGTGR